MTLRPVTWKIGKGGDGMDEDRIRRIEDALTELICLLWGEAHGDIPSEDMVGRFYELYERFGSRIAARQAKTITPQIGDKVLIV